MFGHAIGPEPQVEAIVAPIAVEGGDDALEAAYIGVAVAGGPDLDVEPEGLPAIDHVLQWLDGLAQQLGDVIAEVDLAGDDHRRLVYPVGASLVEQAGEHDDLHRAGQVL